MLLPRNNQWEIWGRTQTALIGSQYDDGSYDSGGNANVFWTPSIVTPYFREDNTTISILPPP